MGIKDQDRQLFEMVRDANINFLMEWEAESVLGAGAYGKVYKVVPKDPSTGEVPSALKIIEMKSESVEQYLAEITTVRRMQKEPHVVEIKNFVGVRAGGSVYLVILMELLQTLPKDGLPESEVRRLGTEMCGALEKCHSRSPKIIHCDIKPDNILMSESGAYCLGDFGVARLLEGARAESQRGSPAYMSPEMCSYKGYDHRTDIYSLGVTMYALLNGGRWPFFEDQNAIGRRLSGEAFPALPNVSRELQNMIGKMCEIEPSKRFQTAGEVRIALENLPPVKTTMVWVGTERVELDQTELILDGRKLADNHLEGLRECVKLEKLYLYNNDITDVRALAGLKNLKKLSLRGNKIADIEALKGLTELTELYLSQNRIRKISALEGLVNLMKLSLDTACLTPAGLSSLKNFTKLRRLWLPQREDPQIKDALRAALPGNCMVMYYSSELTIEK